MLGDNPFQVSDGIDPKHPLYEQVYVERRGLEAKIIDNLHIPERPSGNIIFGPRQIGKTSLLKRMRWQVSLAGWQCAFVTVPSRLTVENRGEWYTEVSREIFTQLDVSPLGLSITVEDIFGFEASLKACAQKATGLRGLLIFDKIDTLICEDTEWARFLRLIRQLSETQRNNGFEKFAFLLSSRMSPWAILRKTPIEYEEDVSALFDSSKQLRMVDWGLEGTQQLTALLNRHPSNTVEMDLAQYIYQWTDGHPYLTQRLLRFLWANPNPVLGRQDVDRGIERILADDSSFLGQRLSRAFDTRVTPIGKVMLQQCIRTGALKWEDASNEHTKLEELGLVRQRQTESSTQMVIRNKIYEQWLRDCLREPKELSRIFVPRRSALADAIGAFMIIGLTVGIPIAGGWWTLTFMSGSTTWTDYLSQTLGQISWLPPISALLLFAIVAGLITYVLVYTLLWMFLVQSKGGSKAVEVAKHVKGVAPVVLVFDQLYKNRQLWTLRAHLAAADWLPPVSLAMDPADGIQWTGSGKSQMTGDQSHCEVACWLTRGSRLQYALLPWPDRRIVPLRIGWEDYTLPIHLTIIADASEALPYQLVGPLRFVVQIAKGLLQKGGDSNGSS